MQSTRSGVLICSLLAVMLVLVACGGGDGAGGTASQAEWEALTIAKQELDAKRAELAELVAQAEMEPETGTEDEAAADEAAEAAEGEEIAAGEDIAAQIETLGSDVEVESEEFTSQLVAFLNADPMLEGEEPTERQLAALRMKSDEDIILAEEWIVKGGDYKRAIEIYKTALMFDPDNAELKAALADADANRYMSQERFEQVDNGMTESDVRALLGQVNQHNLREYPDKDVVAWFYPTSEGGKAAAVWFRPDKSGELTVYQAKFEAVDPTKPDEG